MSPVPNIRLNDGAQIPQLGFGMSRIDPDEAKGATLTALNAGYRHIDTAQMYGNEAQVGEAIRAFDGDRSEVFITSKLNNSNHGRDDALASFETTLSDLGVDELDLFLVHWPMPDVGDFVDTWKAMEEIKASGRCRSIGVSNFQPHHLKRLAEESDTVPSVNQIEVHPYFDRSRSGARRQSAHQRRRGSWKDRSPGDPALARPAGRHHLPQIGDPQPCRGELRHLRFRTLRRRDGQDHRARPGPAQRTPPGRVQPDPVSA